MNNHKVNTEELKVLIIEDEIHAQKEIARLLALCDYSVIILDYIDNIEDAIIWINNNPDPDLMFFDIQLSDGMSFEIFNHINSKAPVIFTTAFDEFAIKAFKVNSIDYLLKPLKLDELNDSIKKYLSLSDNTEKNNQTIIPTKTANKFLKKILIQDGIEFFPQYTSNLEQNLATLAPIQNFSLDHLRKFSHDYPQ